MAGQNKIIALVLAAGYSSRMGSFKPLLPLGESTVIEQAVNNFLAAGVRDVRVVVGHRAADLVPVLAPLGVKIICNEYYDQGMYSSIAAGVRSFEPAVQAFFLLPGDNPLVQVPTICELLDNFQPGRTNVVYPVFKGERGHPPLISAKLVPQILAGEQPGGLRSLLERYETTAREVGVADQGILLDMDTPVDYQKIKQKYVDGFPNLEECYALLEKCQVPEPVVRHGEAVAATARKFAALLNQAGGHLNVDLIQAAGLLHDLAKGQPNHAAAGAATLGALGYARVAEIVAEHMDINLDLAGRLDEKSLVYLADKLIQGSRLVHLEQRFQAAREKFSDQPEVLNLVEMRFNNARIIQERLEKVLGLTVAEIKDQV